MLTPPFGPPVGRAALLWKGFCGNGGDESSDKSPAVRLNARCSGYGLNKLKASQTSTTFPPEAPIGRIGRRGFRFFSPFKRCPHVLDVLGRSCNSLWDWTPKLRATQIGGTSNPEDYFSSCFSAESKPPNLTSTRSHTRSRIDRSWWSQFEKPRVNARLFHLLSPCQIVASINLIQTLYRRGRASPMWASPACCPCARPAQASGW
jgi:hypothetical protein